MLVAATNGGRTRGVVRIFYIFFSVIDEWTNDLMKLYQPAEAEALYTLLTAMLEYSVLTRLYVLAETLPMCR